MTTDTELVYSDDGETWYKWRNWALATFQLDSLSGLYDNEYVRV